MVELLHPAASHHLPSFITAPRETDVLMIATGIILVLFVLMVGVLIFACTLCQIASHIRKRSMRLRVCWA